MNDVTLGFCVVFLKVQKLVLVNVRKMKTEVKKKLTKINLYDKLLDSHIKNGLCYYTLIF